MAVDEQVSQFVREFLNDPSFFEDTFCPYCGSLMDHIAATFSFKGDTWELPLPFCPKCTAAFPSETAVRRRA